MIILDLKNVEAKKLMKAKDLILIKKWVQFLSEEDLLTIFVDSENKSWFYQLNLYNLIKIAINDRRLIIIEIFKW